ncbi:MAG: hypothetical protein OXI33_11690 [Chloroflexota bacterium]|nr:hypothetical protein [Chloroflexota bacterium]
MIASREMPAISKPSSARVFSNSYPSLLSPAPPAAGPVPNQRPNDDLGLGSVGRRRATELLRDGVEA